jgi:hypothetical protein
MSQCTGLADEQAMDDIVNAMLKIRDHLDELRAE